MKYLIFLVFSVTSAYNLQTFLDLISSNIFCFQFNRLFFYCERNGIDQASLLTSVKYQKDKILRYFCVCICLLGFKGSKELHLGFLRFILMKYSFIEGLR